MLPELLDQFLCWLLALSVVHDYLCSTLPQFLCNRTSYASASTSDNYNCTFQCCHRILLLSNFEPTAPLNDFPLS